MALRNMIAAFDGALPPGIANSGLTAETDVAITNGYAIAATGANDTGTFPLATLPAITDTLILGFRFKIVGVIAANDLSLLQIFRDGEADVLRFRFDIGGNVDVGIDTDFAGTPTSIGSFTAATDDWHYWEVKWLPANSGGLIEVYVDGVQAMSFTGDTSRAATPANAEYRMRLEYSAEQPWVADIYVADDTGGSDNDYLGACAIYDWAPNASGTSDFTGDDANSVDNHLQIDGSPMGSDGHLDGVDGDRQELGGNAPTFPAGRIAALMTVVTGLEPASGSQNVDLSITDGTDSTTTQVVFGGTEETYTSDLVETQPDGGGAWDQASVDGAEALIEAVA